MASECEDMSSSEDYDYDSYAYNSYTLENYEQGRGPPLITKKSRIMVTVVQGDVETLKSLLDSPEWYCIRDRLGYDLLQISILVSNEEVFDFLLSLEGYPFDVVSSRGITPLQLAVIWGEERFIVALKEKGADIHLTCANGDTLLHIATMSSFNVKIAELLIVNGVDINAQNNVGDTALHTLLVQLYLSSEVLLEGVSMFLYYGADISVRNVHEQNAFEIALRILLDDNVLIIQENLFFLTIDEYSDYTLPFDILLSYISLESPLTSKIIDGIADIMISPEELCVDLNRFDGFLFAIDAEYLKALMEKFSHVLSDFFLTYSANSFCHFSPFLSIKNFQLLFESALFFDALEFLKTAHLLVLIERFSYNEESSAITTEICHYLLTYGIEVYESDLEAAYRRYGYCELFKILLHMDIKREEGGVRNIFPALIYDVTFDIETISERLHDCSVIALEKLLDYFAFPKLKDFCCNLNNEELTAKALRLPDVPLLVELARNASRKFLCKRYNITTSRWFYSVLNRLPISTVHKKILSFESKLYCRSDEAL